MHRINSLKRSGKAEIRLIRGNRVTIERIEIGRLIAAGVAYCGAAFFIQMNDRGATRTITLVPDKTKNNRAKKQVDRLFVQDAREADMR